MVGDVVGGIVLIFVAFFAYLIPTWIAAARGRAVGPVLAVNLLLGWTFLGWVVALVWALTERSAREEAARSNQPQ